LNGILLIDKPQGLTSRDVVNHICRSFPARTTIGHAGTLDPLATGLLVICVGPTTRLVEYLQRMEKEYRARLLLGRRSDTDDVMGKLEAAVDPKPPSPTDVQIATRRFIGEIRQIPPSFSAANVQGKRAYQLARRGLSPLLQERTVRIDAIEVMNYSFPHLDVNICCGKGTYVRALARDLGEALGCGAVVEALRRTRIGTFHCSDALPITASQPEIYSQLLSPALAVQGIQSLVLDGPRLAQLGHGQEVRLPDVPAGDGLQGGEGHEAAVFDATGELAAIAWLRPDGRLLPVKVLRPRA
jgi:tRNA pseudouridine55 synthase